MNEGNREKSDIWIKREQLESIGGIVRRIREIRSATKMIRKHRKQFWMSSDDHSRQLVRSGIIIALIDIEISAEALAMEAKRLAIKEAQ